MNKFQTQNLKPSSLYSANLQKFRITKLPLNKIEGFTNLQNLYLDSNRIQKIQGLWFPNLEELSLSDNYIRKIENLGGCPKLKTLNLSYNNIHILENIQNNIHLENINISNQFIPRFIIFIIKPNCTQINNKISNINIENSNLHTCKEMSQFPFLQELNIKNNSIMELKEVLTVVKNCPYLSKINCLNNPFVAANKSTYRNFIIIAVRNLIEVDEKEVKENEKIYVNQLYNRKFGKKRGKSREKVDVDIGKQNLIVTKVSRPPPKGNIPSPYDYYKYH
jgi:Leucine-rich repeat (LRR) protein